VKRLEPAWEEERLKELENLFHHSKWLSGLAATVVM